VRWPESGGSLPTTENRDAAVPRGVAPSHHGMSEPPAAASRHPIQRAPAVRRHLGRPANTVLLVGLTRRHRSRACRPGHEAWSWSWTRSLAPSADAEAGKPHCPLATIRREASHGVQGVCLPLPPKNTVLALALSIKIEHCYWSLSPYFNAGRVFFYFNAGVFPILMEGRAPANLVKKTRRSSSFCFGDFECNFRVVV